MSLSAIQENDLNASFDTPDGDGRAVLLHISDLITNSRK